MPEIFVKKKKKTGLSQECQGFSLQRDVGAQLTKKISCWNNFGNYIKYLEMHRSFRNPNLMGKGVSGNFTKNYFDGKCEMSRYEHITHFRTNSTPHRLSWGQFNKKGFC